jgi:Na+-exporting ATPase
MGAMKPSQKHPFLLSIEDVVQQLNTSIESGLSAAKVQEIQRNHPPNELEGGGGVPWYKVLLKQCSNAMILVRWHICFKNED